MFLLIELNNDYDFEQISSSELFTFLSSISEYTGIQFIYKGEVIYTITKSAK